MLVLVGFGAAEPVTDLLVCGFGFQCHVKPETFNLRAVVLILVDVEVVRVLDVVAVVVVLVVVGSSSRRRSRCSGSRRRRRRRRSCIGSSCLREPFRQKTPHPQPQAVYSLHFLLPDGTRAVSAPDRRSRRAGDQNALAASSECSFNIGAHSTIIVIRNPQNSNGNYLGPYIMLVLAAGFLGF